MSRQGVSEMEHFGSGHQRWLSDSWGVGEQLVDYIYWLLITDDYWS